MPTHVSVSVRSTITTIINIVDKESTLAHYSAGACLFPHHPPPLHRHHQLHHSAQRFSHVHFHNRLTKAHADVSVRQVQENFAPEHRFLTLEPANVSAPQTVASVIFFRS